MFDLKVINSVLNELETERGISREKVIEAIEFALASAYKKEYGKKGQIIKAKFNLNSGDVEFIQSKIVVDRDTVIMDAEPDTETEHVPQSTGGDEDILVHYNPEHHILLEDARLIKGDSKVDEEIVFPLEKRDDFGRIAAQTAKQVIMQKIREAEKTSVLAQFGENEGDIVSGTVERQERGAIYLNMGRAVGFLPYEEQIPGEHFKQGERVRAYLLKVEDGQRGVFIKLSRSHPKFLEELFRAEVPELAAGVVEAKAIAREAGSRSKIAVHSRDEHIDPVGSLVGQRGVRVSTIMSELGGEKIDIIEWSPEIGQFIEDALSPAAVMRVEILSEEEKRAKVIVAEDQQSLAIGKGGQNVRLAAKLTGWKIDIVSVDANGNEIERQPKSDMRAEVVAEKIAEIPAVDANDTAAESDAIVENAPEAEAITETAKEITESITEEAAAEREAPKE